MSFSSTLPLYGEAFIRLLFPSVCAACERLLELEEQSLCILCGAQLEKTKLLPSEEKIRLGLAHPDEGWALFRYEGIVKDLLHLIKFERRRNLLNLFDKALACFAQRRTPLTELDCIVPIPLDFSRRLTREFNQSGLLARKLHRLTGLPVETRLLIKTRSTSAQSLLGREAREMNLKGAFRVSHPGRVRGRSVLLVDDIFTTGATVEEAARTLKAQGASRVAYLTLARTPAR